MPFDSFVDHHLANFTNELSSTRKHNTIAIMKDKSLDLFNGAQWIVALYDVNTRSSNNYS
jgi:hypothetical protein